jgi:hypothetical protein
LILANQNTKRKDEELAEARRALESANRSLEVRTEDARLDQMEIREIGEECAELRRGLAASQQRERDAVDLLERFADTYGDVPLPSVTGPKLWRDFYEFSGDHMILTDEGWEPGSAKQSYIDEGYEDFIHDEVNSPSLRALPEGKP